MFLGCGKYQIILQLQFAFYILHIKYFDYKSHLIQTNG